MGALGSGYSSGGSVWAHRPSSRRRHRAQGRGVWLGSTSGESCLGEEVDRRVPVVREETDIPLYWWIKLSWLLAAVISSLSISAKVTLGPRITSGPAGGRAPAPS